MNFWLFVWVVLAVFIVGIFLWSMQILFRQKQVWKALSKDLKLNYENTGFLTSPVVKGDVDGLEVTVYSEEQPVNDASRRQFRSIILVHIQKPYPTGGIIGTPSNDLFIEQLNLPHSYQPKSEKWDKKIKFHVQDEKKAKAFFNAERCGAIHKLLHIKDCDALFIFDDKEGFYRYETAHPLDNLEGLKKRIKTLVAECKKLAP